MRIIPVMDLMGGVVVRAVAGRRHEYRPIQSQLVDSPDPPHVAQRLLGATGASELYVADLDAIVRGGPVAQGVRELLGGLSVEVLFDGGIRRDSAGFHRGPRVRPVIGSETFGRPESASPWWAYSIDLRDGQSVGDANSPVDLAELAVAAGFETLIVLDVARVGIHTGPGTLELIGQLRKRFPAIELIGGGGIRGQDDIARLADAGADAGLVASALHDGRLRV